MLSINEQYSEIFKGISEGKVIQKFNYQSNTWFDVNIVPVLRNIADCTWASSELRVKPSTIRIGSYDVPEPMRVAPEEGTTYYFVHLDKFDNYDYHDWDGGVFDTYMLSKGICHSTKEAAEIHAKALMSLTAVNPL